MKNGQHMKYGLVDFKIYFETQWALNFKFNKWLNNTDFAYNTYNF
jgi:hypothetical protein